MKKTLINKPENEKGQVYSTDRQDSTMKLWRGIIPPNQLCWCKTNISKSIRYLVTLYMETCERTENAFEKYGVNNFPILPETSKLQDVGTNAKSTSNQICLHSLTSKLNHFNNRHYLNINRAKNCKVISKSTKKRTLKISRNTSITCPIWIPRSRSICINFHLVKNWRMPININNSWNLPRKTNNTIYLYSFKMRSSVKEL